MKIVLKNLKTKKEKYFAGYDISKPYLINWVPCLSMAVDLKKETLDCILNYLYIRMDFTLERLKIID